jgi:hypothetical protein
MLSLRITTLSKKAFVGCLFNPGAMRPQCEHTMYYHWIGYWEQDGYGRQPMENLVLQFSDGRPDGRVLLNKQYIGQHCVVYDGHYDGEGTIFGEWSIGEWYRGNFLLRMIRGGEDRASEDAIQQLEPSKVL